MKKVWKISTREEAVREGKVFFYTGRPCKHGHVGPRYTCNGGCKECINPVFRKDNFGGAPNVHWLKKPIIYHGKIRAPHPLEFERMQDDIVAAANQIWASRVNALGPTMTPREQWPEDIRMQVIQNHLCAWMYKDDKGRDVWHPVYTEGLRADPRYNAHSWMLWDAEHEAGGIWWDDTLGHWMVGCVDRQEKANTMLLTDEQLAYVRAHS